MVRPGDGFDLFAIAASYGLEVDRDPGPSGYGSVSVPENRLDAFLAALRADPAVLDASPIARLHGNGTLDDDDDDDDHDDDDDECDDDDDHDDASSAADLDSLLWHLDAIRVRKPQQYDVSDKVVALLGTGVAYEDYADGTTVYVQASSLDGVTFVDPWDFVNDDAHANDDHQHGTHLATVLAALPEQEGSGRWKGLVGVASGVSLMPVKVLDADQTGDELDLVDGLHWAANHDADVINMSLSFDVGYVPSHALSQALEYAASEGVVLVASAGNDGAIGVSYPAAHRDVIAVGASRLSGKHGLDLAAYSNRGPRLDVLAPGGDLDRDENGDGYADGILGQTIASGDPGTVGYYLMTGTSQAAVITSGAAVHLLDDGFAPEEVVLAMQAGAGALGGAFLDGYGAGTLDIKDALKARLPAVDDYHVAILPYLLDNGDDTVTPAAEITVLDSDGDPVPGVDVAGTVTGSSDSIASCSTGSACGSCELTGTAVSIYGDEIAPAALTWAFGVDVVVDGGLGVRPYKAMFYVDELDVLLAAIDDRSSLSSLVIALSWEATDGSPHGDIAAGYSVVDTDIGTSLPLALVANRATFEGELEPTEFEVDLDAAGLASIPLGSAQLVDIEIDDPEGASPFNAIHLTAMDGLGGSNAELGLTARSLYGSVASGSGTCDTGSVVQLLGGSGTMGAYLEEVLANDGFVGDEGYGGATTGQSLLGVKASTSTAAAGLGVQAL